MCLAIPGKIIKINKDNKVIVDFSGNKKEVDTSLINSLRKGDWLIVKKDLAINKVDKKDAQEIIRINKSCNHN